VSQEQLHFAEAHHDGPQASYSGYQGTPQDGSSFPSFYGQKLSEHAIGRVPSAGQRLALAIVSLVLLMVMIFGLILIGMVSRADAWVIIPILMISVLFGVVVIIINVVFNRT
jgi:hypothetical protein